MGYEMKKHLRNTYRKCLFIKLLLLDSNGTATADRRPPGKDLLINSQYTFGSPYSK